MLLLCGSHISIYLSKRLINRWKMPIKLTAAKKRKEQPSKEEGLAAESLDDISLVTRKRGEREPIYLLRYDD